MVIAMASFTCNDAFVKSVTGELPVAQIMFVRGAMTTAIVLAIAVWMGALAPLRSILQPAMALRVVAEIVASLTYISALGAMPFANTVSILQALPLAVTLGAALFLGEIVGWRRWLAIFAGFAGVLIVMRPGPEGFSMASFFVVASVIGAATRDLCTRRIRRDISSLFISLTTAVSLTLTSALLIPVTGGWQPLSGEAFFKLAGASALLFVGYQTIVFAMRVGDISFVAPFRYTSLLWALTIGFLVFAEVPDLWMIAGVAIIVASGLYTFYRENRRRVKGVAQACEPRSP